MPRDIPVEQKSEFIEKKLMFAIQQQEEKGYDMRLAFDYIINSENEYFTQADKEITKIMQRAVLNF